MAWAKVDDNLAFHPKVIYAGNEAMGVWVRSLSWAMQQLTDGFVPEAIVIAFNGQAVARALIEHGLWHEVEGGYQFNDWCEYQPTREKVLDDRAKAAERVGKWRDKKDSGNAVSNGVSNGVTNAVTPTVGNGVSNTTPTRPDPSLSKDRESASRIPQNFALTEAMTLWADGVGLTVNLESETAKFVDYWTAESGAKAVKRDWVAAWRNWVRRAQDYRPATADVDPWAGKKHLGFDE